MLRQTLGLACLLVFIACKANVIPGPEAQITCAGDDECPDGWRCDVAGRTCYDPKANRAPNVAMGQVTTSVHGADVELTLTDPENDRVALTMRVSPTLDYTPIAASSNSTTTDLSTRVGENTTTYSWDAVTDAGAWLERRDLDADGDGNTDTPAVRYTTFFLHAQVHDADGAGSPIAVAGPFTVGDDAPEVTLTTPSGKLTGDVVLGLSVSDTSSDVVDLEIEVRHDTLDAPSAWRSAALSFGETDGIVALAAGVELALVWRSQDEAGGIGARALAGVQLRARATDGHGYGAWSSVVLGKLLNQTPPSVIGLEAPHNVLTGGSVPVAISYRVADEESDPVDARFEYSLDRGRTFLPCNEYPDPLSEGPYALATLPLADGGLAHTFFWDATGVSWGGNNPTLVQLTVSDRPGAESEKLASYLAVPVGPPSDGSAAAFGVPGTSIAVGFQPQQVAIAPMNAGSVPDLVVIGALSTADYVRVFLGSAPGGVWTFTGNPSVALGLASGDDAVKMRVADLEGDGDRDVVILTHQAILLMRNDGTGALTKTSFAASAFELELLDFNDDGVLDIATSGSALRVYAGAYSGGVLSYSLADEYDLGGTMFDHAVAVGDLVGDAASELAVNEYRGEEISLFSVSAAGGIALARTVAAGHDLARPVVADFDGDGDDDLAAVSVAGDIGLFVRDGNVLVAGNVFRATSDLVAADLDADGAVDLAGVADGSLVVARGGVGGFAVGEEPGVTGSTNLRMRAAYDIDGDGAPELAASDYVGSSVRLFFSRHTVAAAPAVWNAASELFPHAPAVSMALADYDGDGAADILVGGDADLELFRAESTQGFLSGTFAPPVVLDATQSWAQLLVGDFDGDAKVDVFGLGYSGAALLRGAGGPPVASAVDVIGHVAAADLDGDGDLEIAGGNVLLGPIVFYDADASGTFSELTTDLDDALADNLALADLDADGDVDVLATVVGSYVVNTALKGAGLSFGPLTATACHLAVLLVADVNADGFMDVVGSDSTTLGVCLGDGSGGFASAAEFGAPDYASAEAVADFNGDGALDFVGSGSGLVTAFGATALGMPVGDFAAGWTVVGGAPEGVAAADMNADTIPDLAVLYPGDQKVTLMFGQGVAARERFTNLPDTDDATELVGVPSDIGNDRFGSLWRSPRLGWHPVRALHGVTDFAADLRAYRKKMAQPTLVVSPLAPPYRLVGDVRRTRTEGGIIVEARLGGRVGDDLYPAAGLSAAAGRMVKATVPLWRGIGPATVASPAILHASLRADDGTWTELLRAPLDNLASGSGNRFALRTLADTSLVVDVLIDHGGAVLVWVEPD